jgi:hypothetical protein
MVTRILLWSLFDSKTTFEELRESLGELAPPSTWIWNEPAERFGLIVYGDELPDLERVYGLIGRRPDVYEEFDVVD